MIAAGCSPSVRLFEAAACGTPIISDDWPGLDTILPRPRGIILADDPPDDVLRTLAPPSPPPAIAAAARARVLARHTADARRRARGHLAEAAARASGHDERPS